MKVIGLTGGIGSGKTTVATMFQKLGIPVYIADDEAKKLMLTKNIKQKVIDLFGDKAYTKNELNRSFISSKVFDDKHLLQSLNNIVHPEVGKHFKKWLKSQKATYVVKEAAILFENDSYKKCFKNILVVADEKKRISRVQKRDETTADKISAIMSNQWPDEKKIKLADFVIENNSGLEELRAKVYEVHNQILKTVSI